MMVQYKDVLYKAVALTLTAYANAEKTILLKDLKPDDIDLNLLFRIGNPGLNRDFAQLFKTTCLVIYQKLREKGYLISSFDPNSNMDWIFILKRNVFPIFYWVGTLTTFVTIHELGSALGPYIWQWLSSNLSSTNDIMNAAGNIFLQAKAAGIQVSHDISFVSLYNTMVQMPGQSAIHMAKIKSYVESADAIIDRMSACAREQTKNWLQQLNSLSLNSGNISFPPFESSVQTWGCNLQPIADSITAVWNHNWMAAPFQFFFENQKAVAIGSLVLFTLFTCYTLYKYSGSLIHRISKQQSKESEVDMAISELITVYNKKIEQADRCDGTKNVDTSATLDGTFGSAESKFHYLIQKLYKANCILSQYNYSDVQLWPEMSKEDQEYFTQNPKKFTDPLKRQRSIVWLVYKLVQKPNSHWFESTTLTSYLQYNAKISELQSNILTQNIFHVLKEFYCTIRYLMLQRAN